MGKIRINESRLNEIIKESINNVLNEGALDDFYNDAGVAVRNFTENPGKSNNVFSRIGNALDAGKMSQLINKLYTSTGQADEALNNMVKYGIITAEEHKTLRKQLNSVPLFIQKRANEKGLDF